MVDHLKRLILKLQKMLCENSNFHLYKVSVFLCSLKLEFYSCFRYSKEKSDFNDRFRPNSRSFFRKTRDKNSVSNHHFFSEMVILDLFIR